MSELVSHYRIVKKIGSGGMGEVYLAEDAKLHRQVALKMLPPERGADPQRLQRFLREAYAASSLTHPNIAVIYEAGETEQKAPFIAMEYVAGEGLDSRLSKGPLPADAIVELGVEIADALDEAHSKGIIHRDLKPSNVMLTPRGHAKVLDFGLAKMMIVADGLESDSSTDVKSTPGALMGTIPYMSPEQALGRALDHRSDIFSFGALLYEMATGQRAFQGRSSTEIVEQISHRQPRAIAQLNYEIPDELERVIRKCLEKDPESRYQSAQDIVVDLKTLSRDRIAEASLRAPPSKRHRPAWVAVATALLAVGVAAWLLFHAHTTTGTALPVDSLAVLPFVNNDPKTEYLSDGITTGIIDTLSQLPQIRVMSRNSAFRFKGHNVDPQEIGHKLKVRAIVSGRVLQVGDRLTVGVELLDVTDGRQLWGEQYNRQIADIFPIQEEISRDISEKLRIKLTGEQRQRLTRRYTNDPEAYALYLKGRYYASKRTVPALQRGIEFFQQAIEKDPSYAMAYVGLGDCYAAFKLTGAPPAEWDARAKAAAQKALQIDSSIAEAHATLGFVEQSDWNLDAAGREFRRAIELNPNYATAHQWYSLNLFSSHRLDEGFAEIQKAQQLDPLSPLIDLTVGFEYWTRGNDEQAIRHYKSTIDLDPKFGWGYSYHGRLYAARGQCNDGVEALRKGVDLTERAPYAVAYLGYALARCGDRKAALKLASELDNRRTSRVALAFVSIGLGDVDGAFRHLEAAYRDHDPQLAYLSWEPEFSVIRSDPRYLDLARRVGIPP
jgi:serine/threonine protein kinase/Flp pilus assembly protein TadD